MLGIVGQDRKRGGHVGCFWRIKTVCMLRYALLLEDVFVVSTRNRPQIAIDLY